MIVFANGLEGRAVPAGAGAPARWPRALVTPGNVPEIRTARLLLTPCSLDAARASLISPSALEQLVDVEVPVTWPPADLRDALVFYVRQLSNDEMHAGWGVWLVVSRDERALAGSVGFKGKPDAARAVEIGYGIEAPFRRRGYATEAVQGLLGWGWTQGVKRVVAECREDNVGSIRVLERAGMSRLEPRGGMLWWELKTPSS
ncbi:MAG: GNAT family N-acetyltransferase [Actinomycetota bacterium]